MNNIQIFNDPEFGSVRTVEIDRKPYFVANDVAKALGYAKPQNAIATHCRGALKQGIGVKTGLKADGTPATQTVDMLIIPEGDLYRLITHSKLPSAERFESWVFDEVLPSIRKHGAYMTEDTLEKALTSPDFLIQLATKLKDEQEKNKALQVEVGDLKTSVQNMDKVIGELKPKANYVDMILKSPSTVLITQIAQDYGMSAKTFNKKLSQLRIQRKVGEQWILYSDYLGHGYTHSKTIDIVRSNGMPDVKMQTEWTQKGRLFLYEELKKHGIYPMIEQNLR